MTAAPLPPDWPYAASSRIVASAPHRWHVQEMGSGPVVLLIHGAGGSTHTWRLMIEPLAARYRVVAVDLPGQGFTQLGDRARCGLDAMATDLARLLQTEAITPAAIIGHSAGGAIALRMVLDGSDVPVVGLNPALGNFRGVAGWLFPAMAKVLSLNPFTARLFASTTSRFATQRLLSSTGSQLDERGVDLYHRLISDHRHVDATLAMMAQWDLSRLLHDLDGATIPSLFLTGAEDRAVPPDTSDLIARMMPKARVVQLPDQGHVMHEVIPDEISDRIIAFLTASGVE